MNRRIRDIVYRMYDGHCGYCGCQLQSVREMQVDHIEPKRRDLKFVEQNGSKKVVAVDKYDPYKDTLQNYMPTCRICNQRKGSMSLEDFRKNLLKLQERLKTQSGSKSNYNLALKYGLIEEKENNIEFYFEKPKKFE